MKNTPGWVIALCVTILTLAFGGGFFYLTIAGIDDTQFRSFFNTLLNLASVVLSGGAFLTSAAAQRQTNGDLDHRIQKAVINAHEEMNNGN